MSAIRTSAICTLVLLAAYFALRAIAAQCSGPQCDTYFIFASLLLPLLILVVAGWTGIAAASVARKRTREAGDQAVMRRHATWIYVLIACTLLGVLGPIVSAVILRDNPNLFVALATLLVSLVPISALIYSFAANGQARPPRPPR
jgi:cell division protein FtsW (lipid II flippase)